MKVFISKLFLCLAISILVLNIGVAVTVKLKFTKLECFEFDRPFADFKNCYLKALARDKVALNVHVRLHQKPVTNATVNAQFFRKGYTQSYTPLMYNDTVDFCKFLKNPNRLIFWKIIYNLFKPYSNINHTCPFDHDIIVDNLILDGSMLKMVPFPSGDYLIKAKIAAYNHYKAAISIYVAILD